MSPPTVITGRCHLPAVIATRFRKEGMRGRAWSERVKRDDVGSCEVTAGLYRRAGLGRWRTEGKYCRGGQR